LVLFYIGRKIARVRLAISVVIEEIARRSFDDWPSLEEARRVFPRLAASSLERFSDLSAEHLGDA
jgi:hypothetical protein